MYMLRILSLVAVLLSMLSGCNKDETIVDPDTGKLTVTLDSDDGVYVVTPGNTVTVMATVSGAVDPRCRWIDDDDRTVCEGESMTFTAESVGEYYFVFSCIAANGMASIDIRIDVVDNLLPSVSLPDELSVIAGESILIEPALSNADDVEFLWTVDGEEKSHDRNYTFTSDIPGTYVLALSVANSEGKAESSTIVTVVERPPLSVIFEKSIVTTILDRPVYLKPEIGGALQSYDYTWYVDGVVQTDVTGGAFLYKPVGAGKSDVTLTVCDGDMCESATVSVECLPHTQSDGFRASGSGSSATQVKIFEYMPAPGQFVGRITAASMEEACELAGRAVNTGNYVSLGGFGGYIVAGFDHSVPAAGYDYDFGIAGNSFDTSNEPGIVWVMQDENGNGLPDDTWYELKGSEWNHQETWQDYAVSYFRPSSKGMPVPWSDNRGQTGTVVPAPSWPSWVDAASVTFRGTRLKDKTSKIGHIWQNAPFGWGYADNLGSDIVSGGANSVGGANFNGFSISNAVFPDGTPVGLLYIDFVKVQTGVMANTGVLGEVSTEVLGFIDYSMGGR